MKSNVPSKAAKKVLLIGSNGYIGSFLLSYLSDKFDVSGIDLGWFNSLTTKEQQLDYNTLSEQFIQSFDSIILLAGHSSVKMCERDMTSSFNNNIKNFQNLLNKMNCRQKLIYASSSSVYGMVGTSRVSEDYSSFIPHNNYDVTKHIIDSLAQRSEIEYYGLRFGTVNGYSPNTRSDVMINSMVYSAMTNNEIKLYIKDVMRPILGLNDLSRAVDVILDNSTNLKGLYNLASFSNTAENIAKEVSRITKVPITHYTSDPNNIKNAKLETKCYNFDIDCTKFKNTFNFAFYDTLESLTENLILRFSKINFSDRSSNKKYE